ncbi:bifunctional lysine-specific demethylase and histidyl-hydroxylase NO66 [Anopheles aquasalis]|uniref:bifunctional lysine-specific demethylase and histidyl-hydroxylase NO66 n=1 Tax=Anopheles aquasalis TaxID=42839 RepID=UPI00215AFECB|nr:bifunctional lysine-specific demethylase and histidyl-hydroxylase NO66 [Anopheles aquasalis]
MATMDTRSPLVLIETPLVIPGVTTAATSETPTNKKATAKRKKSTASPALTPVVAAISTESQQQQRSSTPTAKAKTAPTTSTTPEVVNGDGERLATSLSPDAPAPKKQKKKHPSEGGHSETGAKSSKKKPAKQMRFHIKLYPPKPPTMAASTTATTAKKKKAKSAMASAKQSASAGAGAVMPAADSSSATTTAPTITASTSSTTPSTPVPGTPQTGKKPAKRNRSKANKKMPAPMVSPMGTATMTVGEKNGTGEGGDIVNRFMLPPSTSFTPWKHLQIKQEPKIAKDSDSDAGPSGSASGPKQRIHYASVVGGAGSGGGGVVPAELDSVTIGRQTFAWLIGPMGVEEFVAAYWERKPLLVQRNDHHYYAGLLSRVMIDEMLRTNNIEYTKNIDITSYVGGHRETHNPEGRVLPPEMWHYYGEGCSVRMLNPQTYLRTIYELNVKLQEYFHCMTGANFYLTPPNSQGFAPHYDDIEAFVLQIEGRKRWRLYPPRRRQEVLARVSSENIAEHELGSPIVDVVLEAGDLLYFPRGCIHQAATVPGAHSLHVTLSVYQRNSWADLFEQMLPIALATAAEEDQQFRAGLPFDLHQHFGIVHSDEVSSERRRLTVRLRAMFDRLFSDAAIDAAVDQLAKRFQHDALPPMVDFTEWDDTVYGRGNYEFRPDGTVECARPIEETSSVRLLRRNILRLVSEEDKLRIYYHTDNSREYHQYEANFLELDSETALGVELLIKMYPRYIPVSSLPVDDRLEFIRSLWEKGLIVCRRPPSLPSPSLPATTLDDKKSPGTGATVGDENDDAAAAAGVVGTMATSAIPADSTSP